MRRLIYYVTFPLWSFWFRYWNIYWFNFIFYFLNICLRSGRLYNSCLLIANRTSPPVFTSPTFSTPVRSSPPPETTQPPRVLTSYPPVRTVFTTTPFPLTPVTNPFRKFYINLKAHLYQPRIGTSWFPNGTWFYKLVWTAPCHTPFNWVWASLNQKLVGSNRFQFYFIVNRL